MRKIHFKTYKEKSRLPGPFLKRRGFTCTTFKVSYEGLVLRTHTHRHKDSQHIGGAEEKLRGTAGRGSCHMIRGLHKVVGVNELFR